MPAVHVLTAARSTFWCLQDFLSLEVDDVPAAVHRSLHENAERLWEQSGNMNGAGLGNNIWPAVPQLGAVLRSAVVHGGLHSILGEGYVMNAHRHMHNSSTQGEQDCRPTQSCAQPLQHYLGRTQPRGTRGPQHARRHRNCRLCTRAPACTPRV